MIRFSLRCSKGHEFESWFASGQAFETLRAAGHLNCAHCGDTVVEKSLMAPRVRTERKSAKPAGERAAAPAALQDSVAPVLGAPDGEFQQKLAALRKHVEENADYVGNEFAREARRIHLGEAPERAIYGEARIQDAKALIEEGVQVAPLPFRPRGKSN